MFGLPGPNQQVERWHLSPVIDIGAYSLSWVFVLVPLVLLGPVRADYLWVYLFTIAVTDLHRHFGLPYVYLDAEVRRRYPARFWLFPAVLGLLFVASPWLDRSEAVVSVAGVCALAAQLVVLVQVLRRDGGPAAVPWTELVTVLALMLAGALAASVLGPLLVTSFGPPGLDMDHAWWWLIAALLASAWFDRRLRTGPDPSAAPLEQAIASDGGPPFAASTLILALLGFALLLGPWIARHQVEGGVPIAHLLGFVGAFAALWNFWHVYMQKFGILRMYSAKARPEREARAELGGARPEVPAAIDKALVLAWLPLYFAYLGPLYREIAVDYFDDAAAVLPGFIDLLARAMPITLPLTIALVVVVHGLWLRAEWRAHRFRNAPRVWMAGGTTALACCFFVFDPVKVYIAFAFSHALEYCVFVWAFQRKRYCERLAHDPPLGRLLRRPLLFYFGMIALFGVALLLLKYWGRWIFPAADRPELLGYRTGYWLGFWGIYQSMAHFYFDGFLWKMRLPSVRANI
jgi:hypothetical protein